MDKTEQSMEDIEKQRERKPGHSSRHDQQFIQEIMAVAEQKMFQVFAASNRQQKDAYEQKINDLLLELLRSRGRAASLEKTCADQKAELQEIISLKSQITHLQQTYNTAFAENEFYRQFIHDLQEVNATQVQSLSQLIQHISEMQNKSDQDKCSALEDCQRTMEEQFQRELHTLKQELGATRSQLDSMKLLQAKTCNERSLYQAKLEQSYITQLEEELGKVMVQQDEDKKTWESFMRDKMEKEQEEFKNSLRQTIESELREESQRYMGMMVPQDKLPSIEEQSLVSEAGVNVVLADDKEHCETEPETDILHWDKERSVYESQLASKDDEISKYKQILDMAVSEIKILKKRTEDLKLAHCTSMLSLEE